MKITSYNEAIIKRHTKVMLLTILSGVYLVGLITGSSHPTAMGLGLNMIAGVLLAIAWAAYIMVETSSPFHMAVFLTDKQEKQSIANAKAITISEFFMGVEVVSAFLRSFKGLTWEQLQQAKRSDNLRSLALLVETYSALVFAQMMAIGGDKAMRRAVENHIKLTLTEDRPKELKNRVTFVSHVIDATLKTHPKGGVAALSAMIQAAHMLAGVFTGQRQSQRRSKVEAIMEKLGAVNEDESMSLEQCYAQVSPLVAVMLKLPIGDMAKDSTFMMVKNRMTEVFDSIKTGKPLPIHVSDTAEISVEIVEKSPLRQAVDHLNGTLANPTHKIRGTIAEPFTYTSRKRKKED